MKTRHAVITDTHVITISETERRLCRVPLTTPVKHISDLWALGKQMCITHFWIMPETAIEAMEWQFLADRKEYTVFIPGEKKKNTRPHAATCRREWGSLEIVVNYPADGNGFAWVCNHPLDILACVDYLTQMLCMDNIRYSSMSVGKEFLRAKYSQTKRLKSYLREPVNALPQEPFKKAGKCEVYFTKRLDLSMVGQTYHLYDKNSAHPAAASSMVTGCGDVTHLTEDIVPKTNPGAYRVTCTSDTSIFDGVNLPTIMTGEWMTLDLLKFAMKQGCTFDIHEAYIFEQHTNIFGDWARDLWQIRQTLKDVTAFPYAQGRQNAYDTIKDIMNFTISAQADNINWWADMVGMARTARLANLAKFAEEGCYPFLVYVDDMAFISSDDNYKTAVPGILEKSDKLGGYKHKYSLLITEQMVQEAPVSKGGRPAEEVGRMLAHFKKFAREKGLINE